MKERYRAVQPMAEKWIYEAMKMKKNVFLTSSVKTVAVSKVLERD